MMNLNEMRKWEGGSMSDQEEAAFFQTLVDSGLCWKLGGKYMRRAGELLENKSVIKRNETKTA